LAQTPTTEHFETCRHELGNIFVEAAEGISRVTKLPMDEVDVS
jgi:hypothetical protein